VNARGIRERGREPQSNGNGNGHALARNVLSGLPLFRGVAHAHLETVTSYAQVLRAGRGAPVAKRGERLPGVIVCAYGSIKLALPRTHGNQRIVRLLQPGEIYGTAAILQDRPAPVDAVAIADSLAIIIPRLSVVWLLERDLQFARNLLLELSERFLGIVGELGAGVQQSALQRLAGLLDSISEPGSTNGHWRAQLPASKTTIAGRLGVTKATMSRLLRELADRGLIAVAGNNITINDRHELARLARE